MTTRQASIALLTIHALLLASAVVACGAEEAADTVALNGKIYTVDQDRAWAGAIAVKGTDIVYVGDDEGARAFIGDETTVADLKGKFLMPGFVSTHEHPLFVMALSSGLSKVLLVTWKVVAPSTSTPARSFPRKLTPDTVTPESVTICSPSPTQTSRFSTIIGPRR